MYLAPKYKVDSIRNSDNIVIDSFRINVVNVIKYFGVLIDNALNFVPHVDRLCEKIDWQGSVAETTEQNYAYRA